MERIQVVCTEQAILKVYKIAGETSRVPTLWVYSENDQLFSPAFAQSMLQSFQVGGGQAEFHLLPPFGTNGHGLFSMDGMSLWEPLAKQFLMTNHLCPHCQ
jgi:pimeloyl-ACP methyl ester carboxylesterase